MIVIIPARGDSKGLPGKNVKLLSGKPLIAYTIEAALTSKLVSRVIVSTDDSNIAEVAEKYGAEVPFLRPKHLAEDDSLAVDTYLYTINRICKEESINVESLIVLQPTSPLRTSYDVDNAIKLFKVNNADSVISYTQEMHPISWHKNIDSDQRIISLPNEKLQNRQDLQPTYYPNGAIYIFKYELLKSRTYYTENSFAYIMPRNRSIDIDYIDDFEYAEFLISKNKL
ncbi:cytidylyltransferase domain-containing protein [Gelidibacter sp. F63206]|uniref:acylneuraminate cytidylyltransferase family protein n=1 Tax=Gelidibacter sp. F63206 TaxID=2926425 RepID=UPI001FF3129E|nr:acylneuraminate cytidylyltransferase family protein [Gelidibacter sp. F63206]MCK0115072.1 acylneuraminate cytidylyltransferase family protein [Gelidibacter sp. F63206]